MAYKDELRISAVESLLKQKILNILAALDEGVELADRLTDAQDGATVLAWSRILYSLADTGNATLTVDSATKTISCLTGANLFSNFRVGRDVQLTNFTNAGNNQTVEIKTVTDDSITLVDSSSGWVTETDTNARAQMNPTQTEQNKVTAITNARSDLSEGGDFLDNVAVATSDRRSVLLDWIW
ncbi:MAG: hypothetical protein OES84_00140 [Kiritimatiellaceae bacterium]|nr:hypothetical protein [Kiritimatiellaceae bacterium]